MSTLQMALSGSLCTWLFGLMLYCTVGAAFHRRTVQRVFLMGASVGIAAVGCIGAIGAVTVAIWSAL